MALRRSQDWASVSSSSSSMSPHTPMWFVDPLSHPPPPEERVLPVDNSQAMIMQVISSCLTTVPSLARPPTPAPATARSPCSILHLRGLVQTA